MASDSHANGIEELISSFISWADGPAGIVRSKEIKIKAASDPNLGLIGVLDLSAHVSSNDDDFQVEPKAKRVVRPSLGPVCCH